MTVIESGTSRSDTRRYTHEELVQAFGVDYRERVRKFFLETDRIGESDNLEWISHTRTDYTHTDSAANYLLWMKINDGKDIIIVSAIPPKSFTSSAHDHPKDPHAVIEKYKSIKGEFDLLLNGIPKRIKNGKAFNVMPGTKHRVKTNGGWALIAIVMENGGLYLPEQLHRR